MRKGLVTFRCPDDLLGELYALAESHGLNVSDLVIFSLQLMARNMADQGMLPPLKVHPLPPPSQATDIRWCRRAVKAGVCITEISGEAE